jgi:hypothetical protein
MNETLVELIAGAAAITILGSMVIDVYADRLNWNGDTKNYLDGVKYCFSFARNVDVKDFNLPKKELEEKYPQLQKYLRPRPQHPIEFIIDPNLDSNLY